MTQQRRGNSKLALPTPLPPRIPFQSGIRTRSPPANSHSPEAHTFPHPHPHRRSWNPAHAKSLFPPTLLILPGPKEKRGWETQVGSVGFLSPLPPAPGLGSEKKGLGRIERGDFGESSEKPQSSSQLTNMGWDGMGSGGNGKSSR